MSESDEVFIELTDSSGAKWALNLDYDQDLSQYSIGLIKTSDTNQGTSFKLDGEGGTFKIYTVPTIGNLAGENLPLVLLPDPTIQRDYVLHLSSTATYTVFEAVVDGLPSEDSEYLVIIAGAYFYMQVGEFISGTDIFFVEQQASDTTKQKWKFRSASGNQGHRRILHRMESE